LLVTDLDDLNVNRSECESEAQSCPFGQDYNAPRSAVSLR